MDSFPFQSKSAYGGLNSSEIAHLLSGELADGHSQLVIAPSQSICEKLGRDLCSLLDLNLHSKNKVAVYYFPRWDISPFEELRPDKFVSRERISTLVSLSHEVPGIYLLSVEALCERIVRPGDFSDLKLSLELGGRYDRQEIVRALDSLGYDLRSEVEDFSEMAVRGGVIDFFGPTGSRPVRLEFLGGTLAAIREFDLETQRTVGNIDRVEVYPAREIYLTPEKQDFRKIVQFGEDYNIPTTRLRKLQKEIERGGRPDGLEFLQFLCGLESGAFFEHLERSPQNFNTHLLYPDDFNDFREQHFEYYRERIEVLQKKTNFFLQLDEALLSEQNFDEVLSECDSVFHRGLFEGFRGYRDLGYERGAFGVGSSNVSISDSEIVSERRDPQVKIGSIFESAIEKCRLWLNENYRIVCYALGSSAINRAREFFSTYGLAAEVIRLGEYDDSQEAASLIESSGVYILDGELSSAVISSTDKIVAFPLSLIFGSSGRRARGKTSANKSKRSITKKLQQIREGDLVVHLDYGICRYQGLKEFTVEGQIGDFLLLEFAGEDKLYLPVENIGRIQKYVAAEGRVVGLSKLGGNSWQKTKQKVQKQVEEMAAQLIALYARRELTGGVPMPGSADEESEFAEAFGYVETEDQQGAIDAVLLDMEAEKPMDRLVCGDVGYGKTEVAMRAAYRAVLNGKQVAVLAPTTVLVEQHYQSFISRFEQFGVKITRVSRFQTPAENKESLGLLAKGKVDIIVGTHRLLSKDVVFKELGLLVIDEEHRFGVAQKEKLKEIRTSVDILALSATPIPRTLHMSLTNIRDLSVIETAPANRQLIRTYLSNYRDELVREAIKRELSREGQVYFIYNRVQTIEAVVADLRELVPEARISHGHGQMKPSELERIMHQFVAHEIDVLVSTTIVESGLDIPNANTIIIKGAENLGLAELYQLRGRVGRSSRRAYSYMLVDSRGSLSKQAQLRLEALEALDDLGVGFKLALQDMEIRGAGNLLGRDQSGQVALVGYELYSRLLKEAVEFRQKSAAEEGREVEQFEPEVNIGFAAHIPSDYLSDVASRLLLYQRLAPVASFEEAQLVMEEIADIYGQPPEEMANLVELMVLRNYLKKRGIPKLSFRDQKLSISLTPATGVDPAAVVAAVAASGGEIRLSSSGNLLIKVELEKFNSPKHAQDVVEQTLLRVGG